MPAHNGILVIINLNRFTLHELCIQFCIYIYFVCQRNKRKRPEMRRSQSHAQTETDTPDHKQKGNLMLDSLKKRRARGWATHQPTNNKRILSIHLFMYPTTFKKVYALSGNDAEPLSRKKLTGECKLNIQHNFCHEICCLLFVAQHLSIIATAQHNMDWFSRLSKASIFIPIPAKSSPLYVCFNSV